MFLRRERADIQTLYFLDKKCDFTIKIRLNVLLDNNYYFIIKIPFNNSNDRGCNLSRM